MSSQPRDPLTPGPAAAAGALRRLRPEPAEADLDAAYGWDPARQSVRANMVAGLDGGTSVAGRTRALSGPADQRLLAALRDRADVVLVGAGTVRAEGYGPLRPTADRRAGRVRRGLAERPLLAVVSGRLDLSAGDRIFADPAARPVLLTCERAAADRRRALSAVADVVVAGDDRVEAAPALAALAARAGPRVLCEGGPTWLATLVAAGALDELCLTLSPVLAGGADRLLDPAGGAVPAGSDPAGTPARWRLVSVLTAEGSLFLRYTLRDPAAPGGGGSFGEPGVRG